MNKARSIDGLQRRSSTKPVRVATASNALKRRADSRRATTIAHGNIQSVRRTQKVQKATVSRIGGLRKGGAVLGLDDYDDKKEVAPRLVRTEDISENDIKLQDGDKEAVKQFLSEVKDSDVTDLASLPANERRKKRKEKNAEKPNKKKRHILRWFLLILLVTIIGVGVWGYNYFNSLIANITEDGNILTALFSDPTTPLEKDALGRTNILVFGTEGYDMNNPNYAGGYLTDSMMLISIDQESGDAKAVSLPRDLKARTCTATSKLNEVFYCQYTKNNGTEESIKQQEEAGAKALEEAFEEVLGVKIQYHAHLNWAALVEVVDAIGGIDVVFTYGDQTWDGDETTIETTDKRGLADGPSRNKLFFSYPNGEVIHLNGTQALGVARTRNAYGGYGAAGGNFSREYFQQRIIEAVIKKMRNTKSFLNLTSVLALKSAIGDNLRTNFKDTEIKTLLKLAKTIDFAGLQTIPLYGDDTHPAMMTTGMVNEISYVLPVAGIGRYDKIHAYIKQELYTNTFSGEKAEIVVLNATSKNGYATNEKQWLNEHGFTVENVGNAPSELEAFDGVKVYTRTSDKPKTLAELEKVYNTSAVKEIPECLTNYNSDFIIVLGGGFSHDTNQ